MEEADGQLTPSDVEVRLRTREPGDVTAYDVELTIWAKHYPARAAKLDEAAAAIRGAVDRYLNAAGRKRARGWVYILLSPASFAEF